MFFDRSVSNRPGPFGGRTAYQQNASCARPVVHEFVRGDLPRATAWHESSTTLEAADRDEVVLANAGSIHRVQGSEYAYVVLPSERHELETLLVAPSS